MITALLGIATALSGPGCARFEQFRQKERAALASVLPNRSKTAAKTGRPVDEYAQSIKSKRAQGNDELLANRGTGGGSPTRDDLAGRARSRETPGASELPVALGPPIALDDDQPVLASNTTAVPPRWEPRRVTEDSDDEPTAEHLAPRTESEPRRAAASAESVVAEARAALDGMTSYQVHLNRQERVGAKLLPVEDVLLSVRREPKAVRLEWPDGPHKGREVIYSATENGGLMQVNMADSPIPVPRMSLPPDSPLVMSNSRHPITEAGFDTIVRNLERALELEKAGTPTDGKVEYAGLAQADGLSQACHKLVRVTPAGETWIVYVDPGTHLPALVQANAADGSVLERYLFLDPRADVPALAHADAFDATRRWGPAKGLLSRLGRAGADATKPPESVTR